jgi:cytochrome c oxidase subunit II
VDNEKPVSRSVDGPYLLTVVLGGTRRIVNTVRDIQTPSERAIHEKEAHATVRIFPLGFLLATCVLVPMALSAADNGLSSLNTSIFAPESTPAHSIVRLSVLVLAITGAIFVVVFGLIIYAVVRFRVRADDDGKEPAQVYGSDYVEMAWTLVPVIIVVVLTLTTARIIHEIQDAPKPSDALDVQVIGHQFWWEFRYPKFGVETANELHVPLSMGKHRALTFLDLRSADVVHSFWVPRLAGKTELVPNKTNTMWMEPERTGLYFGQCAKYCGTQHALMLLRVYVDTPEAFSKWIEHQQALAAIEPDVAGGKRIFERTACINCHTVKGTTGTGRFGPDLTHMMSRDTLGSGIVKNTPENLRAWIKNPNQFKPGALMPAMNLSDDDLDQLVAYLSTLK